MPRVDITHLDSKIAGNFEVYTARKRMFSDKMNEVKSNFVETTSIGLAVTELELSEVAEIAPIIQGPAQVSHVADLRYFTRSFQLKKLIYI